MSISANPALPRTTSGEVVAPLRRGLSRFCGHTFESLRINTQLGSDDNGFSLAGLVTLIAEAIATFAGAIRLTKRQLPDHVVPLLVGEGVVAAGVGPCGLGEAAWCKEQMLAKSTSTSLISAGAGPGIWLALAGGTLGLMPAALEIGSARNRICHNRRRLRGE